MLYGISDTFSLRNGYGPTIQEKMQLTEYWADEQIKIAYFVTLAKTNICKISELNIIFRPHPSEDFNYYNSIFDVKLIIFLLKMKVKLCHGFWGQNV